MTRLQAPRLHAVSANSESGRLRVPVLAYRHPQAVRPRPQASDYIKMGSWDPKSQTINVPI